MLVLKEYEIQDTLYEGEDIVIYKGIQKLESKPVIIKTNRPNSYIPRVITKISHEFEITRDLTSDGILKPEKFLTYPNGLALIFNDYGGKSLTEFIKIEKINLEYFLQIAIGLSQTFGEMHSQNVIHKDIKPQNIIILPNGQARLIDFGISSKISLKIQHLGNPDVLEGTLAYISPEQTGRMNRVVDYRTDFYSFGVLLYELITDKLPFASSDSMELVHCHIAIQPESPTKIKSVIPIVISEIILKLLSKNAEDRYQSGFGLKTDLEECLNQYRTKGRIDSFPIGAKDFSGRFQIRQKLYGRETDVQKLMVAFQRASLGAKEILLVSGVPGVGKSALVNEIHKPITAKRGYFISGKYDQFQKNIPYFAIRQAFEEFVKLLLTEKKELLAEWKKRISDALGTNGKILIDIIPNLELIIGEQPEVPELGPQESQIRFNIIFQNFIRQISRREHPLVVFIDDLQWADSASLNLLNIILSDKDIKYFLIVCSYRDNEVDSAHPFIRLIDEIKKETTKIELVLLTNLELKDVNELISDSLNTDKEKTKELTDLVFKKTIGNAFFTTEFLKSLYEEELLAYNHKENSWRWDVKRIVSKNMTDNVVVLMTQKLEKLSPETQQTLKLASCIGNKFNLRIISIILEKTEKETLKDLWGAVEEDLVIPLDENYKFIGMEEKKQESEFKFVHDRVQQASYTLIADDHKKEIHLKIGRLLLSHTSDEELADRVFDIANQFNNSLDLLQDEKEKLKIARLNLMAALKARAATAYEGAKSYLDKSLSILTDKTWEDDYDLMLQLHHALIEVEFLRNNPERAEGFSEIVLKKAKLNSDRLRVFELKAYYFNKIGEFARAFDMVVEGLKSIKYKLKRKPGQADILLKLLQAKAVLSRYSYEKILHLPLMTDKDKLDATKFYALGAPSAYMSEPNALPILTFEACMLSVKNGISPSSSYAFSLYGLISCGALGDIENGYKYGELSFQLWDRAKSSEIEPRLRHIFFGLIRHWKYDLRSCIAPILETTNVALSVGDYDYYAYSLCVYFAYKVYVGENLKSIHDEFTKYTNIYRENMEAAIQFIAPNIEYAVKLMQPVIPKDFELSGKYFDAKKHLPLIKERNLTALAFYLVAKIHLAILFKDYVIAMELLDESRVPIDAASVGMYDQVRYYFFKGIIHAKLIENKVGDKKKHTKELNFVIKKFKKWAGHCPANHKYSYIFLQAIHLALDKKNEEASLLFEESIGLVEETGFVNDIALINELTAEFYFSQNKKKIGNAYIKEAHKSYLAWGAIAKVAHLQEHFPELFEEHSEDLIRTITQGKTISVKSHTHTTGGGATTFSTTAHMDIESVVKVSQALSGEIHLENLFQKMMKILIENAGAQRCFLILLDNDRFLIQAEGGIGLKSFPVLQSLVVNNDDYVPLSLIEYVARTKESLVLKDATGEGNFTQSDYIINNKPKSVICSPIVKQGQLFGILYLENNLVTGAFTPSRLEILRLLSSQIGISIENALLYANLEGKVKERTTQLEEKTLLVEEKHRELTTLFDKVNTLKRQQDGDYFLNTLLIRPLSQNNAISDRVSVQFFSKQKKSFSFKNSQHELGGDVNISETILLQGKRYIVFLNGDAMGKSIQGAGGVLVLGTVFKSIIQRTISTAYGKSTYPERWLKNAFIEMHKAFESFDGSMLMSAIFGLVDENTGTMYFMNSEHPDIVLLRDRKAIFIENKNQYRKLGTEGQTGSISVEVFSLQPEDIVVMGSDGRDDLVIGKEPITNADIINLDEKLFLHHVEKAEGDLEKIYEFILKTGNLMDDLSMLGIKYVGKTKIDQRIELDRKLKQLNEYKEENQFEKLIDLGQQVILDYPELSDCIYEMANAYKETRQFDKAIDFGERMRLREPKNLTNLINLIYSYEGAGKTERANHILEACLKVYPIDDRLTKIKLGK